MTVEETKASWHEIMNSEFMLLLCGAGFLLNMIKQSVLDWGQMYMMEDKSVTAYNAGQFTLAMEFGGALGTTIIGALSDFAIKHVGLVENSAKQLCTFMVLIGLTLKLHFYHCLTISLRRFNFNI